MDKMIGIASLYFSGMTDSWYNNWNKGGKCKECEEFETAVCVKDLGDQGLKEIMRNS